MIDPKPNIKDYRIEEVHFEIAEPTIELFMSYITSQMGRWEK